MSPEDNRLDKPETPVRSTANSSRYVAVEGPIGAGKTTLVNRLSERFGVRTVLEVFEENPFLTDFYDDRESYAFQTEVFFLLSRYKQQKDLAPRDADQTVVSDYLFAKCRLFAGMTLSDHELQLYDQMYTALENRVPVPDVVVHLQAPTEVLMGRIDDRGRSYEEDMDSSYIEELNSLYHDYFSHFDEAPVVDVDTTKADFSRDDRAVDELAERIDETFGGT